MLRRSTEIQFNPRCKLTKSIIQFNHDLNATTFTRHCQADDTKMAGQGIAVTGEIKFDQTPPKSPLPKPSVLIVKLQDCRRAGAAAIDVGSVEVDAHLTYHEGQPLVYTMKVPSLSMIDYSVSMIYDLSIYDLILKSCFA